MVSSIKIVKVFVPIFILVVSACKKEEQRSVSSPTKEISRRSSILSAISKKTILPLLANFPLAMLRDIRTLIQITFL